MRADIAMHASQATMGEGMMGISFKNTLDGGDKGNGSGNGFAIGGCATGEGSVGMMGSSFMKNPDGGDKRNGSGNGFATGEEFAAGEDSNTMVG
jgi:hypothetical protein